MVTKAPQTQRKLEQLEINQLIYIFIIFILLKKVSITLKRQSCAKCPQYVNIQLEFPAPSTWPHTGSYLACSSELIAGRNCTRILEK